MYLLVFQESADGHTSISAQIQFCVFLYVKSLATLEDLFEDMWTLGVCDFFNCLKNVKTFIEIIHLRDNFYKKKQHF